MKRLLAAVIVVMVAAGLWVVHSVMQGLYF